MSADSDARRALVLIDEARRADHPLIVLIDGGSGSGKSTFAGALRNAWPEEVQLIHLDDIYPGWNGLRAASEHITASVLRPLAEGSTARWQRWDWTTDSPAEWTTVRADLPIVVEGSGTLSRENAALATFSIWLEEDAAVRKQRALARDGATYQPHWDTWAAQEDAFARANDPRALADLIVGGDFTRRNVP